MTLQFTEWDGSFFLVFFFFFSFFNYIAIKCNKNCYVVSMMAHTSFTCKQSQSSRPSRTASIAEILLLECEDSPFETRPCWPLGRALNASTLVDCSVDHKIYNSICTIWEFDVPYYKCQYLTTLLLYEPIAFLKPSERSEVQCVNDSSTIQIAEKEKNHYTNKMFHNEIIIPFTSTNIPRKKKSIFREGPIRGIVEPLTTQLVWLLHQKNKNLTKPERHSKHD